VEVEAKVGAKVEGKNNAVPQNVSWNAVVFVVNVVNVVNVVVVGGTIVDYLINWYFTCT